MKITYSLLVVAASFVFVSCSEKSDSKSATEIMTNTTETVSAQGTTEGPVQPIPSVPATPAAASGSTANNLNPAHGEPGHRCDIAVGAPLSSAPASTPTSPTIQSANSTAPTP